MATAGIVLCADDYGIAPGVSGAIRSLLDLGRLSATNCMVVSPDFAADGALLAPYLGRIDVGLHLTLTQDRSLASLMLAAFAGRLDAAATGAEVERQIARFTEVLGRAPDFIDGHQHVHLLPGVREAVAAAALRLGAYVRLTREPLPTILRRGISPGKAAFLSLLSLPLARRARQFGLAHNAGFLGVRSFTEPGPFRILFKRMIAGARAGSLVMCHPGVVDAALRARDPVTQSREEEYRYFMSAEFPADLKAANLRLMGLADALKQEPA